jgi:2-dehydropantoate 2-reductase
MQQIRQEVAHHPRQQHQQQRIAVVGTGAVGGYYGARLWEAGHDVVFYMRSDYEAATQNGLMVQSILGDIHIPPERLQAHKSIEGMKNSKKQFDWVLVALKSFSLDIVPELIHPLLDDSTRVLVIMNGMVEEDLLDFFQKQTGQSLLECCQAVYGGMAFICSNRIAPASVSHSYYGQLTAGVACSRTKLETDEFALQHLFQKSVVEVAYTESLLWGRWLKMIWNLPFNGISVAMGGITVDQIVQDPGLRKLAYQIMDETIAIANADLESHSVHHLPKFGDAEKHRMMNFSDEMGCYQTSTMLDLVNRRPMEVRYLFREPLNRAHALSIPAPHLETIVTQIEAYQRLYGLF